MRLTDDISILAQIQFLFHTCFHLLFPYLICYCKVVIEKTQPKTAHKTEIKILREKTEIFKS